MSREETAVERAGRNVPDFVKRGFCVYDDPGISLWHYDGLAYIVHPEMPDGVPFYEAPKGILEDCIRAVAHEMAVRGMRLVLVSPEDAMWPES